MLAQSVPSKHNPSLQHPLIGALGDMVSFKEAKTANEIRQDLDKNLPSPDSPTPSSERETMSQTSLFLLPSQNPRSSQL